MAQILIDHREQADTLINCLTQQHGISVESRQLKFGDYHIYPDTVVERKTTRDFCLSIIDGRLFNQAFRLAQLDENPLIIIEGEHFLDHDIDIKLSAVRGALISLAQTYRIPVLRTHNETDTAWHLAQLYVQRERIGKNRGVLTGYNPQRLDTKKQRLLCTLPGIGTKMAKTLLEEFDSVSNVINASRDELLKVPGMGDKTIDRMQQVVREQPETYGI
ncbi:MAG: helix-hairpin-helix domain-containing protein [Victivallaceae bacterium]|nr:helix-hairpin-helix domain-containing protein [Victivallaceae bacterium]